MKLFNCSRNFALYVTKLENETVENKFISFIRKNYAIKSSNKKQSQQNNCFIKLGKSLKINLDLYLKNFLKPHVNLKDELFFFEYIYFNNIVYSIKKDTKFTNHVISVDEQLGIIKYIFKSCDQFYIVCSHLIISLSPFYCETKEKIKLKSNFSFYSKSSTYFIVKQNQFKKIKKHFIFCDGNNCMVTMFNGTHLFS